MIGSWKAIQEELSLSSGRPLEGSTYDYKERLKMLNGGQRKAVFHGKGPCLVSAVPGAGKTMALTMRFIRLVISGVDPKRILCCTFTKKAANEMKERIMIGLNSENVYTPFINTMHSVFYKMLHSHPRYYRSQRIPVITRYFSRLKYFLDAAKSFGDDVAKVDFKEIVMEISNAKNQLMNVVQYRENKRSEIGETNYPAGPGCANVWDYYEYYEKCKERDGVIDFDDMIYKTYHMFVAHSDILTKWQKSFDYIMVDEFQDINKAQWETIKLLSAAGDRNLFMVGDANQSIYGFRGSRPEFLYNIKDEVPGTKILKMAKNYRSADEIIHVANNVASNMEYSMTDIEGRGLDGAVISQRFEGEREQAKFVVSDIERIIKDGVNPEEIGVIYRTNNCAGLLELMLARAEIKFVSSHGDGFFGSKVIKDYIAYMVSATTDDCESSLSRIINCPNRYLGAKFVEEWECNMEKYGATPKEALLLGYRHNYWERNASELYFHLQKIKEMSNSCEDVIRYISDDVGYVEHLNKDIDNLDYTNTDLIRELEFIAREKTVSALLKAVVGVSKHEVSKDAVRLMTIHGSKGLEFEHVYMVSLIEGILPHKRSSKTALVQEERRMFFVGITRAKKVLNLCFFVGDRVNQSRFIEECGLNDSVG